MSNSKLICKALAKHGPLTKAGVIEKLGFKSGPGAKAGYNVSAYFIDVSPFAKASGSNLSLVASGHVVCVGTEGRANVYGLTAKGLAFAAE